LETISNKKGSHRISLHTESSNHNLQKE